MTSLRTFILVVTLALGCSQEQPPVSEFARLKTHPAVSGGSAIEPGSVLLTLETGGAVFMDGRKATVENVAALDSARARPLDPVLIEVAPDMTVASCTPILSAVIMKARRRNVSFLVSSPSGLRALAIPVIQARGMSLKYTVGRVDRQENESGPMEPEHVWLSLRLDTFGHVRVVEIVKKLFDEIRFLDEGTSDSPDPRLWTGPHPPLGTWSFEQLKRFLEELKLKNLAPYCDLHVAPSDRVQDFLKCLDELYRVEELRTIVSFVPAK